MTPKIGDDDPCWCGVRRKYIGRSHGYVTSVPGLFKTALQGRFVSIYSRLVGNLVRAHRVDSIPIAVSLSSAAKDWTRRLIWCAVRRKLQVAVMVTFRLSPVVLVISDTLVSCRRNCRPSLKTYRSQRVGSEQQRLRSVSRSCWVSRSVDSKRSHNDISSSILATIRCCSASGGRGSSSFSIFSFVMCSIEIPCPEFLICCVFCKRRR